MMFFMAWLFWFFSNENEADDTGHGNEENEPDLIPNEQITLNKVGTENSILLTSDDKMYSADKNSRKVIEENIDMSFIHFDESEMDNYLDYDKELPKFLVPEEEIIPATENFEESQIENPFDYDLELESFPTEEEIMPITVLQDENENYNFIDGNYETDPSNEDYELSSAVASDNEEVMNASLHKNRLSALIEYRGKSNMISSSSANPKDFADQEECTAAVRIHSIAVQKEDSDLRIRSTSPCIRPQNSPHQTHKGYKGYTEETTYMSSQLDDDYVIPKDVIFENKNTVPDNIDTIEQAFQNGGKKTVNPNQVNVKLKPGKLQGHSGIHKVDEMSNSPSAKLTEFETVMRSRKMHTDTMDTAANVLGNLGHRKEKIRGSNRKLSKHWAKLQDAVSKRQFHAFKERLPPDSSNYSSKY